MYAGLLSWNRLAHTYTFGTQEVMEYDISPVIYHIYVVQHMQDHSLPCFTLAFVGRGPLNFSGQNYPKGGGTAPSVDPSSDPRIHILNK